MDIKDDQLRVLPLERNEKGDKLEPEERPAERRLIVGGEEAQLRDQMGNPLGAFKQAIALEMPAIDLANGVRANCFACAHWNQRAWHALLSRMMKTKEGSLYLDRMRNALIGTGNASEDEHGSINMALMACGICELMTEASREPVITYPQTYCPTVIPDTYPPIPFGDQFKPRDVDSEKFGSMAFDSVMDAALGRS